jgi:hypothetical protein
VKRAIIENELGIIDSHSQHQVLQLRWYIPLLSTSFNDIQPNSPQMITVVWIKLVASYIMNTDTVFSGRTSYFRDKYMQYFFLQ